MVRDILRFLITLSVVMFLLGLALGLYLGIRSGMTPDFSAIGEWAGPVRRA